MKKFKPFFILLFILALTSSIAFADSTNVGHNSNFRLRYGSGKTLCTDTSSSHSYWTVGNANNTRDTRLVVYILNSSGNTVVSDSSSSYSTYASAWWTRGVRTTHGHRAGSSLVY